MRFLLTLIFMYLAWRWGDSLYIGAYLTGSIPFGWLWGMAKGVNLLLVGSRTIGMTAVLRELGKWPAFCTFVLDIFKCAVPIWLAHRYGFPPAACVMVGVFAVMGHCFSVYLKGLGGKGASPALGMALALDPFSAAVDFLVWIAVRQIGRITSLATICGALVSIALAFVRHWCTFTIPFTEIRLDPTPLPVFNAIIGVSCVVLAMHRPNWKRLRAGTEPRLGEKLVAKPGFTFLGHAQSEDKNYLKNKILEMLEKRHMPEKLISILSRLPGKAFSLGFRYLTPVIKYGTVKGIRSVATGQEIDLNFVGIWPTAKQLMAMKATKAVNLVIKGLLYGLAKYNGILGGLGAYTGIVGDGGREVAKALKGYIAITTGNSLTAVCAVRSLIRLATEVGRYVISECTITIIGGSGSIGKAAAKLLVKIGVGRIILVAQDKDRLIATVNEIGAPNVYWTTDLKKALSQSELVICAVSTEDLECDPSWFKKHAIVVEMSRPRALSDFLSKLRPDVLVIAGGMYEAPGDITSTVNIGLRVNEFLACITETIVLALEGLYHEDFSIGKDITLEQMLLIESLAEKHGFKLGRFRGCDDKPMRWEVVESYLKARGFEVDQDLVQYFATEA